jgi:hypothetical protein
MLWLVLLALLLGATLVSTYRSPTHRVPLLATWGVMILLALLFRSGVLPVPSGVAGNILFGASPHWSDMGMVVICAAAAVAWGAVYALTARYGVVPDTMATAIIGGAVPFLGLMLAMLFFLGKVLYPPDATVGVDEPDADRTDDYEG